MYCPPLSVFFTCQFYIHSFSSDMMALNSLNLEEPLIYVLESIPYNNVNNHLQGINVTKYLLTPSDFTGIGPHVLVCTNCSFLDKCTPTGEKSFLRILPSTHSSQKPKLADRLNFIPVVNPSFNICLMCCSDRCSSR